MASTPGHRRRRTLVGHHRGPTFGREEEVAAVRHLLHQAPPVMVTITGRAGVGKTRLARQVALSLSRDAGFEVIAVPLSDVSSHRMVIAEIADVIGLTLLAQSDPMEAVARRLGGSRALLVLDNFEHVLSAARDIDELLDRAPSLRVLVTSQAALRIAAERNVVLAPLPVPEETDDVARLASQPAVALYCARASAVDNRFALTAANGSAIAVLCRSLEGLPLAIEIAAARSRTLPAAEVTRRLGESGLGVLRSPRADLPARHHALDAAIGWTYRQLAPDEQRLLRRVSLVPTPFLLDEVEAMGASLDHLGSLVDFHLVDPLLDGEPVRYSVPSSIRAFAVADLVARGERRAATAELVTWSASWARSLVGEFNANENESVMRRIALGSENLVSAARTALRHGWVDDAVETALAPAAGWSHGGYDPSREQLLTEILAAPGSAPSAARSQLTSFLALLVFHRGDTEERGRIIGLLDDAERIAREVGDELALLESFSVRTLTVPLTGDVAGAAAAVSEGLEVARRAAPDRWIARFELLTAALTRIQGDDRRATELATSGLERSRRAGYLPGEVAAGAILRPMSMTYPELRGVAPSTEECLELAERAGMAWTVLALRPVLVLEAVDDGDRAAARERLADALDRSRDSGTPTLQGFSVAAAVAVAALEGEERLALELAASLGAHRGVILANSSVERAAQHAATVERCRQALGAGAAEAESVGVELSLVEAIDHAAASLAIVDAPRAGTETHGAFEVGGDALLTGRQQEVLQLIATGMRNAEIASALYVSPKTVMHHTSAIYRALGVRGRSEATAWAIRHGMPA